MSRLLLLTVAAVAVTLAVPSASAAVITISGLETIPTVKAGESHPHSFGVALAAAESENVICAQEATVTVTLQLGGTSPDSGFNGSLSAESVTFTIPAGAHLGGAGTGWAGAAQNVDLTIEIGGQVATAHEHTYTIDAAFNGALPQTCQGTLGAVTESADAVVPIEPIAGGPGGPAGTGGTNTTEPAGGDDEEGPAPGLVVVLGAVGLAALLRRRRA